MEIMRNLYDDDINTTSSTTKIISCILVFIILGILIYLGYFHSYPLMFLKSQTDFEKQIHNASERLKRCSEYSLPIFRKCINDHPELSEQCENDSLNNFEKCLNDPLNTSEKHQ